VPGVTVTVPVQVPFDSPTPEAVIVILPGLPGTTEALETDEVNQFTPVQVVTVGTALAIVWFTEPEVEMLTVVGAEVVFEGVLI